MKRNPDPTLPSPQLTSPQVYSQVVAQTAMRLWSNNWLLACGLLLLCLVTRLIAIPASLWEWDEILFASALHRYNVPAHSPHPPGFPVFVAMGRVAYALLGEEQKALAAVNVLFAVLLGPSLFYFYREVFADRAVALAGAILGSFAPNFLVYSGASRSDGPALTLGLIGLTLVIRGCRSRRSLLVGCALFGVALGVRVTLFPLIAPALAVVLWSRLRRREWRLVFLALLLAALGVLCWYLPVIWHTTWRAYHNALRAHQQYVLTYDSIFGISPSARPALRLNWFFLRLWGVAWIMWTMYLFSVLGVLALAKLRRWQTLGWLAISFLPFLIFTFLINFPVQAVFHGMPYTPLFTGLAGAGIVLSARLVWRSARAGRSDMAGLAIASLVSLIIAGWSYPIIELLHREVSPPVRALHYLRSNLDASNDILYFERLYEPHVGFFLPRQRTVPWQPADLTEVNLIAPLSSGRRIYGLSPDPILGRPCRRFHWTPGTGERRLGRLSLGRYFDVYVTEMTGEQGMVFLSGWNRPEYGEDPSTPWMSSQGKVALANRADRMRLHIRADTTLRSAGMTLSQPGSILVLRLDGLEIARLAADGSQIEYSAEVRPNPQRLWSVLSLEINQTINLSRLGRKRLSREFGLQCDLLEWLPAPESTSLVHSPNQFVGPGWGPLEDNGLYSWRWVKERAVTNLPPTDGDARLALLMAVPESGDGNRANITVEIAGQVLERFQPPTGQFTRVYSVPARLHRAAPVELALSSSHPSGLQVFHLGWRPAE